MEAKLEGFEELRALAHRAYRRGRRRTALVRAGIVTLLAASVAVAALGPLALRFVPVSFVIAFALFLRGRSLARGGRYGLLGGALSFALPLSWLRPCCAPSVMAEAGSVCTMPEVCVGAGALLGFALVMMVPQPSAATRGEFSLGLMMGVIALAGFKCSALFFGEALGLLGGVFAGVIAMSILRALTASADPELG